MDTILLVVIIIVLIILIWYIYHTYYAKDEGLDNKALRGEQVIYNLARAERERMTSRPNKDEEDFKKINEYIDYETMQRNNELQWNENLAGQVLKEEDFKSNDSFIQNNRGKLPGQIPIPDGEVSNLGSGRIGTNADYYKKYADRVVLAQMLTNNNAYKMGYNEVTIKPGSREVPGLYEEDYGI